MQKTFAPGLSWKWKKIGVFIIFLSFVQPNLVPTLFRLNSFIIIMSDIFPPECVIILWSSEVTLCILNRLNAWKPRENYDFEKERDRYLIETKIYIYPHKNIALLIKRVRREINTIDLPGWLEHSER